MRGINLRKAFFLGGILLLSVFLVTQLSWACDDGDKWDRDCHDRWRCDHYNKPCHPPKIQGVYLYYEANSIVFEIWGKNFSKGAPPVVTLGGIYNLTVDSNYDDEEITATLPIEGNSFAYGDYRLVVSTCHDSSCEYKYCKDYCFKCKDKHCRDYCSKCKDRYCKHKYCKDHEHKCRCKDRYSLTIAGPAAPPGLANFEIVHAQVVESGDVGFVGTVYCSTGFKVIGGWFSQSNLIITLSGPFDGTGATIDNGWRVEGTSVGANPSLHIWALCAKVQ